MWQLVDVTKATSPNSFPLTQKQQHTQTRVLLMRHSTKLVYRWSYSKYSIQHQAIIANERRMKIQSEGKRLTSPGRLIAHNYLVYTFSVRILPFINTNWYRTHWKRNQHIPRGLMILRSTETHIIKFYTATTCCSLTCLAGEPLRY